MNRCDLQILSVNFVAAKSAPRLFSLAAGSPGLPLIQAPTNPIKNFNRPTYMCTRRSFSSFILEELGCCPMPS